MILLDCHIRAIRPQQLLLHVVLCYRAFNLRPGFNKVDFDGNGKISMAEANTMKNNFDEDGKNLVSEYN